MDYKDLIKSLAYIEREVKKHNKCNTAYIKNSFNKEKLLFVVRLSKGLNFEFSLTHDKKEINESLKSAFSFLEKLKENDTNAEEV